MDKVRQASFGEYKTRDGKHLSYRKWGGEGPVIICIHGIESHSLWFTRVFGMISSMGFTVYGFDRRGSGLNSEAKGDVKNFGVFLEDIEDGIEFVASQSKGKKIYLLGICWGGLLIADYLCQKQNHIDGAVFLAPAIYRKVDFNFAVKAVARLCHIINPQIRFKIPIKDAMFTKSPAYLEFIGNDSLRLRSLTTRFFDEILKLESRFEGKNHRIPVPVLLMLAGKDDIIDNGKVKEWFSRLETDDKEMRIFEGFSHVMPFEDEIGQLVDCITGWIAERKSLVEDTSLKN